ncbi:MAG: tungstate ABC transporter substrate-binding protein WtpA [Deltaproteobacteria bacterium]|nr:tungstate ABC transporter substrate-binding protein WtpA [Deltaproteobacteria bacterium]
MKEFTRGLLSIFSIGICLILSFTIMGTAMAEPSGKVIVLNAGSLTVPLAEIEKRFEARYPDIDILREAGGSTKMARMISELKKPADIFASADFVVIDKELIPAHAEWNARFATNQLVLCYTEKSRFADEINADNWHDILARKGVVWGHSDPNLDPCGYRSLMVLQLAEKHYGIQGLYDRLMANRPKENIRPKSVELISLLKTGNMDYAWEYLSVAVQHEVKYVVLDDHINLGNYRYDDFYGQAKVEVTGSKPGIFNTLSGASCTYGITMVKDAPNPEAAVLFLEYMLSPDGGLKVLDEMGQPPFIPCWVPDDAMHKKIPEPLKKLIEVAK